MSSFLKKYFLKRKSLRSLSPFYDYIIVGAGTAGCLLANRLTADPTKRTLLIEAGPPDSNLFINVPLGYLKTIGNPNTD